MDYIYQSPIHCSKVNLKCVIKCNKFTGKQSNGDILETKHSSIEHQYKKLGDGFNKKRGKKNYTCPMFDNELLASSKKLNIFPEILFFQSNRKTYAIIAPSVVCLVD